MSGPSITVQQLAGPNLEADRSVTVIGIAGFDPPGGGMDGAWQRRWRTTARAVGLAVPDATADRPSLAAAVTADAIASSLFDRPAAAVRPGRLPGSYVLAELPAALAGRIASIGLAVVDLSRAAMPAPPVLARIQAALRGLAGMVAAIPGQVRDETAVVLADAAQRLGVPWRWAAAYPGRLAIGEGRRQTLFDGSSSLSAPVLGVAIGGSKLAAKRYLEAFRIPTVPDRIVARPDAAAAAAAEIGYPVVVKPMDGSLGKGVSLDVRTPDAVRAAADKAFGAGSAIMLEPYLPLADFRAIMVGGDIAMIFQRHPAYVVGDGKSTVAALLAALNQAVAEKRQPFPSRYPVQVDDDVHRTLANAGLSLDAVPEAGRRVVLRTSPLRSRGGYTLDVTATAHPSVAALLRRVAALVRLPVVSVDFRCEALERPLDAQRLAVLEFNDRTDLSSYPGHPMQDAVIRLVAPDAEAVRMPTLLMLDAAPGEGPLALRRAVAERGWPVAVAGPDEFWLGGLTMPAAAGAAHLRMIEDPTLAVAVHWTTPEAVASGGLGAKVIDIAWTASEVGVPGIAALVRDHARSLRPLPAPDERVAALLAAAGGFL